MLRDHLWLVPFLLAGVVGLTLIPLALTWWLPVEQGHPAFSAGSSDSSILGVGLVATVVVALYIALRKFLHYHDTPQTNR